MDEYLFDIAASFQVTGRGLVLCSNLQIRQIHQHLKPGQLIEFRLPSGNAFRSRITSIELSSPFSSSRPLGFMVERAIQKEEVPVGTAVWLVSASETRDDEAGAAEAAR